MKQQNGFIATSLLYSFFLAFVTVFIVMITLYLQNRVYLDKLEDSSKNNIYIREMKKNLDNDGNIYLSIYDQNNDEYLGYDFSYYNENKFAYYDEYTCNVSLCETIYINDGEYVLEGCPDSCLN